MTELSKTERLILANQFTILAELSKNEYDKKSFLTKAKIVEYGYTGSYWTIFNSFDEEIPIEICNETNNILNMYRVINNSIATLTEEEKKNLDLQKIEFDGFDANNDSHYWYMTFLIEEQDKWGEYKDKNINSHSYYSLYKYRKMLQEYNRILEEKRRLNEAPKLNINDLKKIIEVVKN